MEKKKKKLGVFDKGYQYPQYDTSGGFGSAEQTQESFKQRMNFTTISTEYKEENKGFVQSLYDAKNLAELKKAYRKLMMIHHPDKNQNSQESKEKSQHIIETFEELEKKFL